MNLFSWILKDHVIVNKDDYQALVKKSTTDALTGFHNRHYLLSQQQSLLDGHEFCAVLVDVDNFKKINDSFGHDFGDVVLQKIAANVKTSIRNLGDRTKDLLLRYGGEEFLVILHKVDVDSGISTAERLRKSVNNIIIWQSNYDYVCNFKNTTLFDLSVDNVVYDNLLETGHITRVSVSVGVAACDCMDKTLEDVIQRADEALYLAKNNGKNTTCVT